MPSTINEDLKGSLLSDADHMTGILQLVSSAGDGGMSEEHIEKAMDKLHGLAVDYGLFGNWMEGRIVIGYDAESDELLFTADEAMGERTREVGERVADGTFGTVEDFLAEKGISTDV